MSVEKYRIKKGFGFTVASNNVIKNLNNYEALGLYLYLLSLPEDWIFHKKHLATHGLIGRDKINKLLTFLSECNLIDFIHLRNDKGQFAQIDLHIKDGSDFKINNLEKSCAPFTEKPLTDNQSLVNSTYKRKKTKEKDNTKEISHASQPDAQERDFSFDQFWSLYPKKKDKKRCKEKFKKLPSGVIALILVKLEQQVKQDVQWKELKFIPYPSTYLENERWTDDISIGDAAKVTNTAHSTQKINTPTNTYGGMRDFTQERLDREMQAAVNKQKYIN